MPLVATRGAASSQGFGEFARSGPPPVYIEDVFSTYLYTGTAATNTISNNIDLSGEGGLVWTKNRLVSGGWGINLLIDTVRGLSGSASSGYVSSNNSNGASGDVTPDFSSFNSNGYSLGAPFNLGADALNGSGKSFVSWTFRKAEKFFDVVTYTGNGTAGRTVSHNLGSTPGFILVKRTDTGGSTGQNWAVWHRSAAGTGYFNSTNALDSSFPNSIFWGDGSSYVAPTSTQFTVTTSQNVNANGGTYVAYLFAHNAGGFGTSGSDNVITCGSYTGTGSAQTLSLGYEPQWVLIKQSSGANDWNIWDNMRGLVVGGTDAYLQPNTSNAENSLGAYDFLSPTATGLTIDPTSAGFNYVNTNGQTYIYIAIRRGPMKTPTSGTSVFSPNAYTGTGAGQTYTTNFPVDMTITSRRSPSGANHEVYDRLRPWYAYLFADTTAAEGTAFGTTNQWLVDRMDSVKWNAGDAFTNTASNTFCTWNFRRAPGFFDVVCYTGTGANRTVSHNLGVAPELMIVKRRNGGAGMSWAVYSVTMGNTGVTFLDLTLGNQGPDTQWNSTTPTASVFSLGSNAEVNSGSGTYVAYLFATCAGVSKVGSYTGTGALQTVNCGFTGGARFVLIKRTDSTGDWWVYDSARGISSGNDPYLFLNSTDAEVTGTNYVDTTSVGFQVTAAAPAGLNANGGSYIFLAVA